MKLKDGIIIHGPGRSGTTLLSNILALHENIGWLSNYVNKYPKIPQLTYFNRLQEIDSFEKWNRGKSGFPRISEAYNFWLHYIPEFNEVDLKEIDAKRVQEVVRVLYKIHRCSGKSKFMTKITGYSRHQTLAAVFDNPMVIWIDRDPLAVIASYYKLRWGYKDKPEVFESLDKRFLLEGYTNKYLSFQKDKSNLERFSLQTVRYEDLVADTSKVCESICRFTGVSYSKNFRNKLEGWKINTSTNEAYRKILDSEDIEFIQSMLR
jgi:hypothetical protein|tara:strand:+ start:12440 stop:13231 length:792 start_codon:yes stop_codon:yes gene_type:complete